MWWLGQENVTFLSLAKEIANFLCKNKIYAVFISIYVTVLKLSCLRLKVSINFHDCLHVEKRKKKKKQEEKGRH